MAPPRRDPAGVIAVHKFDPTRRTLFVEGVRDRIFVTHLLGSARSDLVVVQPIEMVELPDGTGGNRQRILNLLALVEETGDDLNIRGLVDRDNTTFTGEALPKLCWATDLRDAEGYVLSEENLEVALRLGCGFERADPADILDQMEVGCRFLAAVRLANETHQLGLRVGELRLTARQAKFDSNGGVTIDQERVIRALMQKADVSLGELDRVQTLVQEAVVLQQEHPRQMVVQGKDAMKLLTAQIRAMGCTEVIDAGPLLWATFRRENLHEYPALDDVVAFLIS